MLKSLLKIALASAIMGVVAYASEAWLHDRFPARALWPHAIRVFGGIGAGVATLALAAWVLRDRRIQSGREARARAGAAIQAPQFRIVNCELSISWWYHPPVSPSPSRLSYSFGPGPMTPAVRAIIYANIAVFLVTLFMPGLIVDTFGLSPALVLRGSGCGSS